MGVVLQLLRVIEHGPVALHHRAIDRGVDLLHRLNRLNRAKTGAPAQGTAGLGQLHKDDVAELLHRKGADPQPQQLALGAQVFVAIGVAAVGGKTGAGRTEGHWPARRSGGWRQSACSR